jgi:retron-type reverse transcriptase
MKLEASKIKEIRERFAVMQTRSDLLALLNDVKPIIFGDRAQPFKLNQLTWYSNPKFSGNSYQQFAIRKKSGSERKIHAPSKGLKAIQSVISLILQCVHEPHKASMGFTMGKCITDNAALHVGKRYVYNLDLKDFFPSVEQARVWNCLKLPPFNLKRNPNELNSAPSAAKVIDVQTISGYRKKTNDFGPISIKFLISGRLFSIGSRSFQLPSSGIVYYALKYSEEEGGFVLEIDLVRSNFEQLKELLQKNDIEKENDITEALVSLYMMVMKNLEEISLKDNRDTLANLIASLCCTEIEVERYDAETNGFRLVKRNVLPQGAPTSPVLTNIVCARLDRRLSGVANRFGLKYSRYADDITFSSMHNVYQTNSEFIKEIRRIIEDQNFTIKESKTRLQRDGYRKEVTGLLVNEKVNAQKRYIKQLRMWLYYWERYGYERASSLFIKHYLADKGHMNKGKIEMSNVIAGKLDYLKMIKGESNKVYKDLFVRYHALGEQMKIPSKVNQSISELDNVLNILLNYGIEKAMKVYRKVNP